MSEPDLVADYVAEGVAWLHMSDEAKDAAAARQGISRAEFDLQWQQTARAWIDLDPDDLIDEQYEALFDRPKPA